MNNFNNTLIQVLSPYGNWNHQKGMQVVDKIAGDKMRANFPSIIGQKLFRKIPVYEGHPDDDCKKTKRAIAVGYVEKIVPLNDAIVAIIKYDEASYKNILSGKFSAMSPRWQMESLPDGTYRPVKLISVGLTNNPNIPESGKILSYTSLTDSESETKFGLQKIKVIKESISDLTKKSIECIDKSKALACIQKSISDSRATALLANAINKGAIASDECPQWKEKLSKNFSDAKRALIRKTANPSGYSASDIIRLTKEEMAVSGSTWEHAFDLVKKNNSI